MNETFDFSSPVERAGTHCLKYDRRETVFGRADVLPLWVADMDFAAPPCVREALSERLQHPVLGYSFPSAYLYESLMQWFAVRHDWHMERAQIQLTPGVVPSVYAAVQALTGPGDGIIVPGPVYPPLFAAVERTERRLVNNTLVEDDNGYSLDFEQLGRQAKDAKVLLFCSPHNPVGRVWTRAELEQLIALALEHGLIIVSDDIHCDLVHSGHKHIPLATLAPPELRLVTCLSPSKTFNIPGLNLSALVCSHAADQRAIEQVFARLPVDIGNPLNMAAFAAAYAEGGPWLDALLACLAGNQQLVLDALAGGPIHCRRPEATALMWLDCRELQLDSAGLKHFFVHQAGLGLNPGESFGPGGEGFMRLNIGTNRERLKQAMDQLQQALAI